MATPAQSPVCCAACGSLDESEAHFGPAICSKRPSYWCTLAYHSESFKTMDEHDRLGGASATHIDHA